MRRRRERRRVWELLRELKYKDAIQVVLEPTFVANCWQLEESENINQGSWPYQTLAVTEKSDSRVSYLSLNTPQGAPPPPLLALCALNWDLSDQLQHWSSKLKFQGLKNNLPVGKWMAKHPGSGVVSSVGALRMRGLVVNGRNAEQAGEIEIYPAGLPWRELMAPLWPGEEVIVSLTPCKNTSLCALLCTSDLVQVGLS